MLIDQLRGIAQRRRARPRADIDWRRWPRSRPSPGRSTPPSSGTTLIHEHLRPATRRCAPSGRSAARSAHRPEPVEVAPDGVLDVAVKAARGAGRARGQDDLRPELHVPRPRRRASCAGSRRRPACRSSPAPASTPTTTCRCSSPRATPTQIADLFVARHRARASRAPTIKAAFIKCAADEPGRHRERREGPPRRGARQPRAPARRSWPTRGPASETGPRQVEIFDEEGVDPSKVQIAHTGDTDDLDYIERPARQGRLHRHGPLRARDVPALRAAQRDRAGAARARLRRADVPLGRLLRDARLVPARGRSSRWSPPG